MKIETDKLKVIVKNALRIIEKGTSLPVLKCLKLTSNGSSLKVHSTDMECEYEGTIEKFCDVDFSIVVDAVQISKIIDTEKTDYLVIEIDDDNLIIEGKRRHQIRLTLPEDEFPASIADYEYKNPQAIDSKLLKNIMKAAGRGSYKNNLNGVFFGHFPNIVDSWLCATNGGILSYVRGKHEFAENTIVPISSLEKIFKCSKHDVVEYSECVDGRWARFCFGDEVIYTRCMEEEYNIPVPQVIPSSCSNTIELEGSEIVNFCQIAIKLNGKEVVCEFSDSFRLLTSEGDGSDMSQVLVHNNELHYPHKVGFMSADLVRVIDSEHIEIKFNDEPRTAFLIVNEDFQSAIMPMKE